MFSQNKHKSKVYQLFNSKFKFKLNQFDSMWVVITDGHGKCIDISDSYLKKINRKRHHFIGKNIVDLNKNNLSNQQQEYIRKCMKKRVNIDGFSWSRKNKIRNNAIFSTGICFTNEKNIFCYAFFSVDVSTHSEDQTIKNLSEAFSLSQQPTVITVTNLDTKTMNRIYVNESFQKLFEYESLEEALKDDVINTYQNLVDYEEYLKLYELSINKNVRSWTHESIRLSKNKKLFNASVKAQTISQLNNAITVQFLNDDTKLKKEKIKEFQIHKLATMGEISANMAHELNQPLNAIRMGVANIKRRISKVDEKDSIDLVEISNRLSRIDAQVSRAATIIDHMRQFGRKDVDIKPFKVNDVVENVRNFIIETCRLGEIQLETQLPDEDLYVEGQWIKLEQVILNITKNAQDQILMSKNLFPKKLIIIVKKNKEDNIIISIEDSGGGIPEDILPSIFDPFFTTKSENEGTGLGLSISREIIQEMNGDIMAVNTDNGAKFIITVPRSNLPPSTDLNISQALT